MCPTRCSRRLTKDAGVSATWSFLELQPPWNVWYSPNQWPASCESVSPSLYFAFVPKSALPPGSDSSRMTTPSWLVAPVPFLTGNVAQPSRKSPRSAVYTLRSK